MCVVLTGQTFNLAMLNIIITLTLIHETCIHTYRYDENSMTLAIAVVGKPAHPL